MSEKFLCKLTYSYVDDEENFNHICKTFNCVDGLIEYMSLELINRDLEHIDVSYRKNVITNDNVLWSNL